MDMTVLAAVVLAAVAAGGVAYALLYPILSGDRRAAKRQRSVVGAGDRREKGIPGVNKRDQVAQSLRELDQREKSRNKITLENRIAQAGLTWTKSRFYMISAMTGFGTAVLLFILTGEPNVGIAGLLAGGVGLPRFVLASRKKRRIKRYLEELPNAIDVIVRGIKSGLPVGDCLRIIASEAQEPVRSEFRFLVEQQALGITIAEAVAKLPERVPVPESNFFAIVVGIQQKAGGNLSETLGNLSRVLRDRKKMRGKIQAMSMEAKASAGIIGALPFVVATLTYLTSPAYIELLWLTFVGKCLLAVAAFWMTCGVMVMKKMINFDF